jgi:AcrR family transcriptional regulator
MMVVTSNSRPANRKEQILQEATVLFTVHGYDGTSIRVIAKSCGITEAAIYRHFDSKENLYETVIAEKARQHDIRGRLAGNNGQGSIEEILTLVADDILSLAERDPQLMQLMFRNSFQTGAVANMLFQKVRLPYIEFLTHELEKRQKTGEVVQVDAFTSSRCFVGMVMDCALNTGVWTSITNQEFNAENVICNNVPIFARGLINSAVS